MVFTKPIQKPDTRNVPWCEQEMIEQIYFTRGASPPTWGSLRDLSLLNPEHPRAFHRTYEVEVDIFMNTINFSPQHFVMSELATMWCNVPWLCPKLGAVLFLKNF